MIYTACEVYSVSEHFVLRDSECCRVFLYDIGKLLERFFRALKRERNIVFIIDQLSLKICYGYADMTSAYVSPDEVSGCLIKSIYALASASGCPSFAQVFQESVFDQFPDESCNCRDAGIQFFTEFCDAEISVVYTKTENLLLHNSSLALDVV